LIIGELGKFLSASHTPDWMASHRTSNEEQIGIDTY